jgi:hypothetical protein
MVVAKSTSHNADIKCLWEVDKNNAPFKKKKSPVYHLISADVPRDQQGIILGM